MTAELQTGSTSGVRTGIDGQLTSALTFVHQLLKDLSWIRHLAKRSLVPNDRHGLARDTESILWLCENLMSSAKEVLDRAGGDRATASKSQRIGDLIDRVLASRSVVGDRDRVTCAIDAQAAQLQIDSRVEGVLKNLLDNALCASAEAQKVRISSHAVDAGLLVAVEDSGCGMSIAELQRCCEMGFTTRASSGGSGVGLAVSKQSIEDIGGWFEVGSARGRGTTVRMLIPLRASG